METAVRRRLSAGVELQADGRVSARVWAPACRAVELVSDGGGCPPLALTRTADGYFEGGGSGYAAGDRYWFRLDGERLRPDPVSRYQPDGPHGSSAIVDPSTFAWTDAGWPGIECRGQVIYEMHVGTFTTGGTWAAASAHLPDLAALGVTVLEIMPVADFPGTFGWGYDGVNIYAPTRLYGTPDGMRAFVDRAHAAGLGVILDVVYNHLGPDGNYLSDFSPDYFTDRYTNDWGRAINYEGSAAARGYFVENAGYWIDEFHLDGLRLDATQDVQDASPEHVIASAVRRAREAAGRKSIYVIAENEPQDVTLVRPPADGGYGVDALWNDDYHHAAAVALTGRREAYYTDYTGSAQEFVSCAKYGYLYQGQWYPWQDKPRGTSALDLAPMAFVAFLENHDQVANTAYGKRLHQLTSPGRYRALTALTLLGPATPLLFQGQEFASTRPFLFFADHSGPLRDAIRDGRREFLAQFPSIADPEVARTLAAPGDESTFKACVLDDRERRGHVEARALHADLLRLRREDPAIAAASSAGVDGAVLTPQIFVIRFGGGGANARLLIVNLGIDADLSPLPEPLTAPSAGQDWRLLWSSESAGYGGSGHAPFVTSGAWHLMGESAILLAGESVSDEARATAARRGAARKAATRKQP